MKCCAHAHALLPTGEVGGSNAHRAHDREGYHPACTSPAFGRGRLGTPGQAAKLYPCAARGAEPLAIWCFAKGIVTRMGRDASFPRPGELHLRIEPGPRHPAGSPQKQNLEMEGIIPAECRERICLASPLPYRVSPSRPYGQVWRPGVDDSAVATPTTVPSSAPALLLPSYLSSPRAMAVLLVTDLST